MVWRLIAISCNCYSPVNHGNVRIIDVLYLVAVDYVAPRSPVSQVVQDGGGTER
jgi:hypothetical protein